DGLWRVRAVDAIDSRADIQGSRAERIARTAGHPARQIGLARDHFRRRRPVRPLCLLADVVNATPLKAVTPHADAIPPGDAVTHDEIEETVVRVDDDRARRLFSPVIDRLTAQLRRQIPIARGVINAWIDIFHGRSGR